MSRENLGLLLGFVGVCIFAGTLPFTHIAVEHLSPLFMTAGRAALAGLLALATLLILRKPLAVAAAGREPWRSPLSCLVGRLSGLHGARHAERSGLSWRRGARDPAARHLRHQHLDRGRAPEPRLLAGGRRRCRARGRLHPARRRRIARAGRHLPSRGRPGRRLWAMWFRASSSAAACAGWEVISWVLVVALPVTVPVALWLMPDGSDAEFPPGAGSASPMSLS